MKTKILMAALMSLSLLAEQKAALAEVEKVKGKLICLPAAGYDFKTLLDQGKSLLVLQAKPKFEKAMPEKVDFINKVFLLPGRANGKVQQVTKLYKAAALKKLAKASGFDLKVIKGENKNIELVLLTPAKEPGK